MGFRKQLPRQMVTLSQQIQSHVISAKLLHDTILLLSCTLSIGSCRRRQLSRVGVAILQRESRSLLVCCMFPHRYCRYPQKHFLPPFRCREVKASRFVASRDEAPSTLKVESRKIFFLCFEFSAGGEEYHNLYPAPGKSSLREAPLPACGRQAQDIGSRAPST